MLYIKAVKYAKIVDANILKTESSISTQTLIMTEVKIETLAARDITHNKARLRSKIVNLGLNRFLAVYFEYSTDPQLKNPNRTGFLLLSHPTKYEAYISNLKPETTYYFRVVGWISGCEKVYGNV